MDTPPNESKTAMAAVMPKATAVRTRGVYTPLEKAEYLALFEQSQMTPGDFCREMGLNDGTFSLWRRAARQEMGGAETGPVFAEVQLSAPKPGDTAVVTVHLPSGAKLEVSAATEGIWQGLGLLLKTLNA